MPILCHRAGLHEFRDGPEVEGFAFGDELAPKVQALEVGAICEEETALHIDRGRGALAIADGLINYGGIRFVPDNLIGDNPEVIKERLRRSYARLARPPLRRAPLRPRRADHRRRQGRAPGVPGGRSR